MPGRPRALNAGAVPCIGSPAYPNRVAVSWLRRLSAPNGRTTQGTAKLPREPEAHPPPSSLASGARKNDPRFGDRVARLDPHGREQMDCPPYEPSVTQAPTRRSVASIRGGVRSVCKMTQ